MPAIRNSCPSAEIHVNAAWPTLHGMEFQRGKRCYSAFPRREFRRSSHRGYRHHRLREATCCRLRGRERTSHDQRKKVVRVPVKGAVQNAVAAPLPMLGGSFSAEIRRCVIAVCFARRSGMPVSHCRTRRPLVVGRVGSGRTSAAVYRKLTERDMPFRARRRAGFWSRKWWFPFLLR